MDTLFTRSVLDYSLIAYVLRMFALTNLWESLLFKNLQLDFWFPHWLIRLFQRSLLPGKTQKSCMNIVKEILLKVWNLIKNIWWSQRFRKEQKNANVAFRALYLWHISSVLSSAKMKPTWWVWNTRTNIISFIRGQI